MIRTNDVGPKGVSGHRKWSKTTQNEPKWGRNNMICMYHHGVWLIFGASENGQNKPEKGLKSELLYRRYKGEKTSMKCDKCDSSLNTDAHVVKRGLSIFKYGSTVLILSNNTLMGFSRVSPFWTVTVNRPLWGISGMANTYGKQREMWHKSRFPMTWNRGKRWLGSRTY